MRGSRDRVICHMADGRNMHFRSQLECARTLRVSKACIYYALKNGNMVKKTPNNDVPFCIDYDI